MREFEAILFDFDGVLVDSEPVHYHCWIEVLSRYGLTLSWESYARNCIGVADRAMIRMLCDLNGRLDLFDAIWDEYPRKKSIFRERIVESVPMPLATKELLPRLAQEFKLAVVSSSGRLEIVPALEAVGVAACFSGIVTGEDVKMLKPAPEPYLKAAELLGVTRALVIEDSEAGIASGRAAGLEVLTLTHAGQLAAKLRARLEGGL